MARAAAAASAKARRLGIPVSGSVAAARRCSRSARSLTRAMQVKARAIENSSVTKHRIATQGEVNGFSFGGGGARSVDGMRTR